MTGDYAYDLPASLSVAFHGPVRLVTMNRPDAMNAADAGMHRALGEVWSQLAGDPGAEVVVLTGAGRAFSAGGDFDAMLASQRDEATRTEVFNEARHTVLGMLELPQPLISAVNGPAVGLGASLAALSDMAVASEEAFLAEPHLAVGLVPADGTALLWPLLIGLMRAKELVLTGDRIPAQRAFELGLVSRVVPPAEVLPVALALAHRLAKTPRQALRDTKRLLTAPALQAVHAVLEFALSAEMRSVVSPEHVTIVADLIAKQGVSR
jgi:enoyl-CoA hydratase